MLTKVKDDDLVMSLVDLALAHAPEARDAYIERACAGDLELLAEVRNYVRWEETMDRFLLDPFRVPLYPFARGELLADRFRMVRLVAEGGMGLVYEAWDERLRKRVAVKCAHPGFDTRLPPEVRHAREIAHPNVCKIFDIHTASTPQGSIEFFTMEFLEGPTLSDRLRRGPVAKREAKRIASQISAGLAEAHRHGIVHGDLKSNNIILVPQAETGGVRAVITDFGLARGLAQPSGAEGSQFESARPGGAPDYMAPELWRGEKATPASDVYALGVVFCELASGVRPSSPEALLKSHPATYRRWNAILRRCLNSDPAQRFQDAVEVEQELEPSSTVWPWILAAAALLAIVVGYITREVVQAPGLSYTLAMLPVESSPDLTALANTLSAQIGKQLAGIDGGNVARFKFVPADRIQRQAADKLGVTHFLRARLQKENGALVLRAALDRVRAGGPLPCVSILCAGTGGDRNWLIPYDERHTPVALAAIVISTLNLPPLAPAPMKPDARQHYEQGLLNMRLDTAKAVSLFEQAGAEDQDSALIPAALAEVHWAMFWNGGRRDMDELAEAKKWLRIAESRDPDVRAAHQVEGSLYYYAGLYGIAQKELERAAEVQPTSANPLIWLAKALEDNNQPDLAGEAFQKATEVEPGYYRTWENRASYYQKRSDYRQAATMMQQAASLAPEFEKPRLRSFVGAYCAEAGEFDASEQELRKAIAGAATVHARYLLGYTLMYRKQEQMALQEFEQAVQLAAKGSNTRNFSLPLTKIYLGIAYRRLGQDAKAKQAYSDGLQAARKELAINYQDGYVNAYLGYFYAALHQPEAAWEEIEKSRSAFRDHADVRWRAVLTYEELYRNTHDQRYRDRTLQVLMDAPSQQLADMNRWPDLADLQHDPQFIALLISRPVKEGDRVCKK
ncbi:MAG: protein kinase [Bryobacterales bacterium]|nr:protein kinase [Bryobacterales bacterium]